MKTTLDDTTRRLGWSLQRRAWSRAGAVAEVLRTGTTRRVLTFSSRVLLFLCGTFLISASVAVTLWTELGPGPLDVFIGAVRHRTGLPLSVAVWATVGALIGASALLGRRPGVGTVTAPLLIGPMLQGSLALLDSFGHPSSFVLRVVLQLVAIAGIGVGSGALIVSGLGAGTGELFAGAASARVGRPESQVRPAIELGWIVVGVGLGGPAGSGTVMVAVLIAPAVANGFRLVDRLVARSVRTATATRAAIVSREAVARERVAAREPVDA